MIKTLLATLPLGALLASGSLLPSGPAAAVTAAEAAAAGIEPYCVPWPIPVERHPRSGGGSLTSGPPGSVLTFEHWRQPCGGSKSQLVLVYIPVSGEHFVCGGQGEFIQNGKRSNRYRLVREVDGSAGGEFCGNLTEPSGFLVYFDDPDFSFDDDASFEFYRDLTRPGDPQPSFHRWILGDYSGDPLGTSDLPPHGDFSGSYFDPQRAGEGALVEIGQIDDRRILQVSWYTYDEGRPLWIYGVADFDARDTRIRVPLQTFAGARFGEAFVPSDVRGTPWGEATISFSSCQHMNLGWARADGEQGEYRYQRTVNRLLGSGCSNESPNR